jgi:hypothetical protein
MVKVELYTGLQGSVPETRNITSVAILTSLCFPASNEFDLNRHCGISKFVITAEMNAQMSVSYPST